MSKAIGSWNLLRIYANKGNFVHILTSTGSVTGIITQKQLIEPLEAFRKKQLCTHLEYGRKSENVRFHPLLGNCPSWSRLFLKYQHLNNMFDDDYEEPKYSEEHAFFATAFLVLQIGVSIFLVWYFFTHS